MSYDTVSDFSLPTSASCPHCQRIGYFRKVSSGEYNKFQSGTDRTAIQAAQVGVEVAKGFLSIGGAVGLAGKMLGSFTSPSLFLMICTRCEKFVVMCPNCKELQHGGPGMMLKNFTISCKKCSTTLTD